MRITDVQSLLFTDLADFRILCTAFDKDTAISEAGNTLPTCPFSVIVRVLTTVRLDKRAMFSRSCIIHKLIM